MSTVRRVYVEKKPEFAVEARSVLSDVQTLNLESNKAGANHAANEFLDVFNFATTNFTVKVTGDQNLVLGQQAKQAQLQGLRPG